VIVRCSCPRSASLPHPIESGGKQENWKFPAAGVCVVFQNLQTKLDNFFREYAQILNEQPALMAKFGPTRGEKLCSDNR
jgi:hypothetical protein